MREPDMSNTPNLSHGRHMLSIPGPSIMPDRVLQAMHRAAPNIYTGELIEITESCIPDLKAVAKTAGDVAMYIGNGHAAWEASLANTLALGDTVLVPGGAQFSQGWAQCARQRGLEVQLLDFGRSAAIDPQAVEDALRADTDGKIKAVLVVQVDTSSSAKSDLPAIRAAMDAAGHGALLMSDSIACLGCDDMQMDAWGVDVVITGSQKGLMVPPGMAFVYMIVHEEGLDNVLARHATLARAVWAACDAWGAGGPLAMNIKDEAARSNAVTSIAIGKPDGTRLRTWLTEQAGATLGIGLGMSSDEDPGADGFFRIGHMGHLNSHMLMGTLGVIDAGLKALDIPHGDGALAAAASVCAGR